jgi:branched-chain amino acid transport system permease protein
MEWLDTFWATYSTLVLSLGTNVLLALSIYLTLSCGMLTVANAAFMGLGAYTAALLTLKSGMALWPAVVGGTLLPAGIALAIGRPTLRLSGVYLAMATLAFGEVVRIIILNSEELTGGALGLNAIPQLDRVVRCCCGSNRSASCAFAIGAVARWPNDARHRSR